MYNCFPKISGQKTASNVSHNMEVPAGILYIFHTCDNLKCTRAVWGKRKVRKKTNTAGIVLLITPYKRSAVRGVRKSEAEGDTPQVFSLQCSGQGNPIRSFGREGHLQAPQCASLVRGYQQGTPPALDFAFHYGFIQKETIVVA
jgi:hypothetical protein